MKKLQKHNYAPTMKTYKHKYLKKLFRAPNKAHCKKCKSKMSLLPENEHSGKILFKCVSSKCGQIIDVSEYKEKYTLNRRKVDKMKISDIDVKSSSNLSLTLTHYRIRDKHYKIDDGVTYNPISRMRKNGEVYIKMADDNHRIYTKKIIDLLKNAKS